VGSWRLSMMISGYFSFVIMNTISWTAKWKHHEISDTEYWLSNLWRSVYPNSTNSLRISDALHGMAPSSSAQELVRDELTATQL
jgi:hypothetical protein